MTEHYRNRARYGETDALPFQGGPCDCDARTSMNSVFTSLSLRFTSVGEVTNSFKKGSGSVVSIAYVQKKYKVKFPGVLSYVERRFPNHEPCV